MQPFSCQHKEQHTSKWNYQINVVLQYIHISRLELQRWSLEFVFSHSKEYIWDLGLRFGYLLLGSCNTYINQLDEFSFYIFQTMKKLNILWKHLPMFCPRRAVRGIRNEFHHTDEKRISKIDKFRRRDSTHESGRIRPQMSSSFVIHTHPGCYSETGSTMAWIVILSVMAQTQLSRY